MTEFFLTFGGVIILALFLAALAVFVCSVAKSLREDRDRAFRNSRAEARQHRNHKP